MEQKKPNKRNDAQTRNRMELLQAAAWVIANHGLSGTTVDRIQARSGLSRGMLNLHFGSKDNLIFEVLKYVSAEYHENWIQAIDQAPDQPDKRLAAIFRADLSPVVLNATNCGVWTAVRADNSFREKVRDTVETRNPVFFDAIFSCCQAMCQEKGYTIDPAIAAKSFVNLLEGLYIDFSMHSDNFDREEAFAMCATIAKSFFPDHEF